MSLSIVSESYDLVLSGLVSTTLLSCPFATYILRPKSGRWFSDRYIDGVSDLNAVIGGSEGDWGGVGGTNRSRHLQGLPLLKGV